MLLWRNSKLFVVKGEADSNKSLFSALKSGLRALRASATTLEVCPWMGLPGKLSIKRMFQLSQLTMTNDSSLKLGICDARSSFTDSVMLPATTTTRCCNHLSLCVDNVLRRTGLGIMVYVLTSDTVSCMSGEIDTVGIFHIEKLEVRTSGSPWNFMSWNQLMKL